MIFVLSIALGYAATNLDGLLLFIALAAANGNRRTITGYLIAQATVILASFAVSAGAFVLPVGMIGLLGLIPIGLGGYMLWQDFRQKVSPTPVARAGASTVALATTFIAVSLDTFVLMAAFFADSAPIFDIRVFIGGVLAIIGLLFVGTAMAKTMQTYEGITQRMTRLAPFVMIAAGIYILLDTSTDLL